MEKIKMKKGERRKAKKLMIGKTWQLPNSEREKRNNRESILEDKKILHDVTQHIQSLEFEPEISYEDEIAALKRIHTKKELGKKHIEFMTKVKEFKGNNQAVLHFSNLAKEVRKLIDL